MSAVVNSIFRPNLFSGKVAIVTGGSTGIGKTITQELLYLGANVVIASRNDERLQSVAKELGNEKENNIKALACNIRDESQVGIVIYFCFFFLSCQYLLTSMLLLLNWCIITE